jgi:hypothetical protein
MNNELSLFVSSIRLCDTHTVTHSLTYSHVTTQTHTLSLTHTHTPEGCQAGRDAHKLY